ncbi:MAG: excinuclease ABC subunit UvrA, partial [Chloroflexi bacterium]|nr:excinuclease ABC subunit UvrA [Chloroflexota bacterium]
DYLRLLFARVGTPHCPNCGRQIATQTADQIVDSLLALSPGTRLLILAPLIRNRKGLHQRIFEDVRKAGFTRVRVNSEIHEVDDEITLDRYKNHTVEAVVDRLIIRDQEDTEEHTGMRSRLNDSVETALKLGDGTLIAAVQENSDNPEAAPVYHDTLYSERFACPYCNLSLGEIEPRTFSFNTPHGACPSCQGLGTVRELDPELVVPNPDLNIEQGGIRPWSKSSTNETYYWQIVQALAQKYGFSVTAPLRNLTEEQRNVLLYGTNGTTVNIHYENKYGRQRDYETTFEGVIPNLQRRYQETDSDYIRWEIEGYMTVRPCPVCQGTRLKPVSLAVTVAGISIHQMTALPVAQSLRFVEGMQGGWSMAELHLPPPEEIAPYPAEMAKPQDSGTYRSLTGREQQIAHQILKEIHARLTFMVDVGLDYLTLNREASTLSGGEAQRIRLATQIGSQLTGVLYILDEPSIGLHQRDNARLIRTLLRMRDLGNTLLVVEHDEETMRSADWIVDLGPGAGEHGGYVIAEGRPEEIMEDPNSLTGAYLSGRRVIDIPPERREGNGQELVVVGATENNLKNVTVHFPLGKFICITGVSGSGKSSLIIEVLFKRLNQILNQSRERPGKHDTLLGAENLDKVIDIDQSPIGRTPRSNPATYTNLFTPIRDLFAELPEAKLRGYKAGRFSFNVKGGRCEACQGDGTIKIEMNFLPDIYVPCEVCHGKRYNRETLQVKYKDKSIADVLDMTVEEAMGFFENFPSIRRKLTTLFDVGLGYIRLGQPAPTLSGGEAQRIKLSRELSRVATGRTLYILDEPTTGLHFEDVRKLLTVLQRLADAGNTVIVIEHNLDVIKTADWVIDLGPEGGNAGGYVIATGQPEDIANHQDSFTGEYLRRVLSGRWLPDPIKL